MQQAVGTVVEPATQGPFRAEGDQTSPTRPGAHPDGHTAASLHMWGDLVQVMMDLARVVCRLLCLLCPERVLRITCKRLPKEAEPWS